MVVRLDAIGIAVILQIDPEVGVRENKVAEQRVVDRGVVMHPDSSAKRAARDAAVEGDDVARPRGRAAYRVIVPVNKNAARVGQRLRACDIGPDDITLDEVAGTVESDDYTGVASIARDQIARRRAGSSC